VTRPVFRSAPFSALGDEIHRAADIPPDVREPPPQVEYLCSYLRHQDSGAAGILVESDYTDRHFIEEFSAYYATRFRTPRATCTRIHIFSTRIDETTTATWIERASSSDNARAALQQDLSDQYLGYIVVRPLPFAPIGRTLLRPYRSTDTQRCYEPAATRHLVHLFGLELTVSALPFQQQDRAVGACATTAVWTALSRTLKTDGSRSVTPREVTEAATRHLVHHRTLPAEAGLTDDQIDAAIRAFGYEPHHLSSEKDDLLQVCLKCYLSSGIPVLLSVGDEATTTRHALVLAGYRAAAAADRGPLEYPVTASRVLRTRAIAKVYAHDDRLGPYVRMLWRSTETLPRLVYEPYGEDDATQPDALIVWDAIVPLYRKLRLTAEDLFRIACELTPAVSVLARSNEIETELRFQLGGSYLSEALAGPLSATRKQALLTQARFSRYVGVIRFSLAGRMILDVLCDTTDIYRVIPRHMAILALIPGDPDLQDGLRSFSERCKFDALIV
jgi:hypothetical protein